MAGTCRLIITADDFGYSEGRNRGIVQAFERGIVQRTSLMVNGVQAEDAVQRAKACGLPMGLHFNISEGQPILPTSEVSTLVTSEGFLKDKVTLVKAVEAGQVDTNQVASEFRAQFARFKKLVGENPLYVDGHQHLHIPPGLTETAASVMKECGVLETRLPIQLDIDKHNWVEDWLYPFNIQTVEHGEMAAKIYAEHGIRWSEYFFGLSTMGSDMTLERLTQALQLSIRTHKGSGQSQKDYTCELMSHPGIPTTLTPETHPIRQSLAGCGEGPDDFEQSAGRQHELDLLTSQGFREMLKNNGVQLVKSCIL